MTGRLAFLALAGALSVLSILSACDAPPQPAAPVQPPPPQETAAPLSAQQLSERSALCAEKAREGFRRLVPDGAAKAADFAHHYNVQRDTCFYLLTITRPEEISRKLLDINENETYGEFLGPASGAPATCRVESMYCASGREWEVLIEPYMRD